MARALEPDFAVDRDGSGIAHRATADLFTAIPFGDHGRRCDYRFGFAPFSAGHGTVDRTDGWVSGFSGLDSFSDVLGKGVCGRFKP